MAKRGRKPTEFDYRKTAERVESELESRKKALVSAERALGKARIKHEELLAEVARLDMLDRSLKAVNDKTEPPTNIKYVYSYPQWVWYSQPWQNGGYTIYNCNSLSNSLQTNTCNANLTLNGGSYTTATSGLALAQSGIEIDLSTGATEPEVGVAAAAE